MLRLGRQLLLGVALPVGLLVAAGCGADQVSVKTPSGSVKVDADGTEFSYEAEDGSRAVGGTTLPEDFPSEVALVEGRILQAVAVDGADGGGYSVNLEVAGGIDEAFEAAGSALENAGFTREGFQSASGAMSTASFRSANWQVLVTVAPTGDEHVSVGYVVAPAT